MAANNWYVYKLDVSGKPAKFVLQTPPDPQGRIASYSKDGCTGELENTPKWFKTNKYPTDKPSTWKNLLPEYVCFQLEASARYFEEAELKTIYSLAVGDTFPYVTPAKTGLRAKAWKKHFEAVKAAKKKAKAKAAARKKKAANTSYSTPQSGSVTWSKQLTADKAKGTKSKSEKEAKEKAKEEQEDLDFMFPDN